MTMSSCAEENLVAFAYPTLLDNDFLALLYRVAAQMDTCFHMYSYHRTYSQR